MSFFDDFLKECDSSFVRYFFFTDYTKFRYFKEKELNCCIVVSELLRITTLLEEKLATSNLRFSRFSKNRKYLMP